MIDSIFKVNKLLKLLSQIFFYSIVIYTTFCFFGLTIFSIKSFVKSIFPTTFEQYWFATTYIILYIFTPYINILIKNLNREMHRDLILLFIILWSIIPSITTREPAFLILDGL
jgi:hypothetical protein